MLKFLIPILFIPLISASKPNNSWPVSATALFLLTLASLAYIPSGLTLLNISSMNLMADPLSTPLVTLTLWISALMILASFRFLSNKDRPAVFVLSVSTLAAILSLFFLTTHLMTFYIMFEASLIPTMFLILIWGAQPERLQASLYLMLYTVTASLPLLASLIAIFYKNASMTLTSMIWVEPTSSLLLNMWWLISIIAFLVKMPVYSLHLWLPKAHVEAPLAGSMVLAAILLKLGSYGLIRLSSLFPHLNCSVTSMMSSLCLIGACVTSAICIRQTDLKALIAYSSIGHMGLLTAAVLSSSKWGWEGALVMMLAHGLSSSALFSIANSSYEATHTRSLYLTKGLLSLFPAMSLWWFLSCAANMSAPPSINLFGEILLLPPILSSSMIFFPMLILSSLLTGVYSLALFSSTQHGHPSNFTTPLPTSIPRNHLLMFLHIAPLFICILTPNFISAWL
uniref:NADH dehydrogenase subunit 4 n=1 Tax=Paralvinella palmiformis TaxID=53620 RepID=UPI00208F9818|nr:NADH dehydrogenase subunit 4 [Paralvinella palmiformis]UJI65670.1 NADH dehydrogenase subunit 4 [Paralvinella palmiformis]